MPDHTHVFHREFELSSDRICGSFRIESHDQNATLSLQQLLQAIRELSRVDFRSGEFLEDRLFLNILLQQSLLADDATPPIQNHHPARSKNERCQFFRLPQLSQPQFFDRHHKNVLSQVRRGLFVFQMAQAIEPDSGSQASIEFVLGVAGFPWRCTGNDHDEVRIWGSRVELGRVSHQSRI